VARTKIESQVRRFAKRLRRERRRFWAVAARVKARLDKGKTAKPEDFAELLELTRKPVVSLAAWGAYLARHLLKEYAEPPLAFWPTTTLPGTPERVAVYAERARRCFAVFHFADVTVGEVGASRC
jgi:hypothetical protein